MILTVQGRLAYAYTGGKTFDAALPCVVFIHGALHDHSGFTLLARWFAHHGRSVLALDLPGHGRSAGPPLADIQAHAEWSLAALDVAGVDRAAWVGHSMGSLVALAAAGMAPARATHLALLGTAVPMKVSSALLELAQQAPLKAIDLVNAMSISSLGTKPSHPGPGSWVHGANRALMRRSLAASAHAEVAPNLFVHDFSICDNFVDGMVAASHVTCPCTVVEGVHDQMTPPRQNRALAAALNAQIVSLASGHHLMAEVPDPLQAALAQALA